jgi:hypothetical protein
MLYFRLKVRFIFSKLLCQTTSRKFQNLNETHLDLIGDKSVIINNIKVEDNKNNNNNTN